jgi:molybdopterin-guanine dinucleotide biosynthesis protein A
MRLIDRAAALALQWSDMVAIAVRSPGQAEVSGMAQVCDEQGIDGPLAGLIAALRFANGSGCEAVLTIPADMPVLPADLRERLAARLGACCAAIASSGGHLHPVCGLWRSSALEAMPAYVAAGRRSLRGFAEAVGFEAVEWGDETDPFFNINRIEDLAAAEQRLRV